MRKLVSIIGSICLLTFDLSPAVAQDFWSFWGDGKGEISSYDAVVPRYGELRKGYAILVFVTEEISRTTRIKVESEAIPPQDRVPVLKLNRVIKFTTGIYDYSIFTSTFSSVGSEFGSAPHPNTLQEADSAPLPKANREAERGRGRIPFEPLKISFSAQEWCGHVFQMLIPQRDQVELTLHSYFQSEGNQQRRIKLPAKAAFEDNLPIWIRELKGEVLAVGQRLELNIFPSAWATRAAHKPADFQPGWILKEEGEALKSTDGTSLTWRWIWQVGSRKETYWVEKAYPHRILKWSSSDGSRGELKKTLRVPYWTLHDNDDLPYREQLGVPK